MRLTIERLRTLVLVAGAVVLAALVGFLAAAKWKNPFNRRDLPQRLGLNIQQEANGWTYTHEQRGHTLYKIHASKLVQLKKGSDVLLHDVKIELYGDDGSRTDRIEGAEFRYNPQSGIATATGEVEITLMRPGVAPAIAPKATANQALGAMPKNSAIASAAQTAATGEILVKTSGLVFEQKSGVAHTSERVQFALKQGSGSSMGASYDSQNGLLVLDRSVELNTVRGAEQVSIRAQHAEFERDAQVCHLRAASAHYREGEATAGLANIEFRDDGSVVRLDAVNGFAIATSAGGHIAAPEGLLEFDEHNQPRRGRMQGGVTLESVSSAASGAAPGSRTVHVVSPVVDLEFTTKGELRHAHLERGVEMRSENVSAPAGGAGPLRVNRSWQSPFADVDFRYDGRGKAEPSTIHGTGGVVVTGATQRGNGPVSPSRLSADEVTGQFGEGSALSAMTALGHASMEQTSATGARQTTTGDRLEAHFAEGNSGARSDIAGEAQIQSATVDGHVVVTQWPAAKSGASADTLRATAGRAVYEGAGEWLHLADAPRVENGGLQLTADKIDVSQASGDAFAHGNVKASWLGGKSGAGKAGIGTATLGGQGVAHAISAEAQLHQATGVATFRGKARLWQDANSVAAPAIVLDRARQMLMATGSDAGNPVRVVLVSAQRADAGKRTTPSVVRVRGGDLNYSEAERRAVMHAGSAGKVVAETATATSTSNEVELILLPAGNHAGKGGAQAQVDRLTARGRVTIASQERRGTGEQLVYTGETEEYVLTGTASDPPRMSDPARGTVTGQALIFHGQDDSVSVEGGGRKTLTETTAPK